MKNLKTIKAHLNKVQKEFEKAIDLNSHDYFCYTFMKFDSSNSLNLEYHNPEIVETFKNFEITIQYLYDKINELEPKKEEDFFLDF